MKEALRETCEKFIRNRDLLKDNFKYEGMAMHLMGAAVICGAGEELGIRDFMKCEDYLDSKAGVLSSLRGMLKMPMIINMAISKNPEEYYETVHEVYRDISESRRSKDERLHLAAMIIASAGRDDDEIAELIRTTGKIYDVSDAAGRFFADMSCYVTAASVAASGVRDVDAFEEELGQIKEILRQPTGIGKVPEDLCMLLAAQEGDAGDKCERVQEISAALDARRIDLGSGDAASMLASLAAIDMDSEEIAESVAEADAYLKEQKGFGFMGTGRATRYLYAAMLTCIAYADDKKASDTAAKAIVSDAIESLYIMLINSMSFMTVRAT